MDFKEIRRCLGRGTQVWQGDMWTFAAGAFMLVLLSALTAGVCLPPMILGLNRMLLRRYDGEPVALDHVFEGFSQFGRAWGAFALWLVAVDVIVLPAQGLARHLLAATAAKVVTHVVAVPATLLVGACTLFVWPYLADERGDPLQAVAASLALARRHLGPVLLMTAVTFVMRWLGLALLYVGVLLTMPQADAAVIACYRAQFPALPRAAAPGVPAAKPAVRP